jgi:glycosyltransferase involved in cell wall biosynthesis
MITIVIPTRNRAYTLRVVAPSYFEQEKVDEIIFVDSGDDDTAELISELAQRYPEVRARVIRDHALSSAAAKRNVGAKHAKNDFILFCDDDEYLELGYARVCLEKLQRLNAGAVSGRRVYMQTGETPEGALQRFGTGLRNTSHFRYLICEMVNGAKFDGDLRVPFTNTIILTRKELLLKYPFDGYYARGSGYREETDYQMNLFVHDYPIYISNDVHSIHLPMTQVQTGGQRTSRFNKIYWSIFYTNYFFKKYYKDYAKRVGLRAPRWAATMAFAVFAVYKETLRPPLYRLAIQGIALKRSLQPS